MKKIIFSMLALMILVISCGKQNPVVSGSYDGEGDGRNGLIKVQVHLKDSVITGIDIVEMSETASYAEAVYKDMRQTIIDNNNINVDMISGATLSSKGFLEAVDTALKSAGIDLKGKQIPVAQVVEEESNQYFDIVVIGAGGAGFSAAIEAKNNGASNVVILEKMHTVGGSTLISGVAMNAANTRFQQQNGIQDSIESFYQDTLKDGDNMGDPTLVRYLVENSANAVDWVYDYIKASFSSKPTKLGGHSVARTISPTGGSGEDLILKLKAKAEELGIVIKTSTKATKLIMENGRVNGVVVEKFGQEITFHANKAVVIASGGFGANVEMREKNNPTFNKNYKTTVSVGNTGDGIVMAQQIGADTVGMEYIQPYPFANPETGSFYKAAILRLSGGLFINQEGNRFMNEAGRRDIMSEAVVSQTGAYSYLVWNEDIEIAKGFNNNQSYLQENQTLAKRGLLVKADSLEEAAEHFKIPTGALKTTLNKVNEYATVKEDLDFGNSARLVPIVKGPYYILKGSPSIHHTMGGLKIDKDTHVIDKNGVVIPGLYAAGEVTGGIHGSNRLSGNAIADIIVFGRTAGKSAAKGL